ncbi:hypothetical protein RsTz2092_01330 [Deferribacterales bacterium RsTz2092]|nr:hypothetical protein AGMMS49941_01940 [Deferribacterales bacterium]
MVKNGLIDKIFDSVANIDIGRQNLATSGKTEAGLSILTDGLQNAISAYQEARTNCNLELIWRAEAAYLAHEKEICEETIREKGKDMANLLILSGLSNMLVKSNDALRSLNTLETNPQDYVKAETTHPTTGTPYRVRSGVPKDAFHNACNYNIKCLQHSLATPGINQPEKELMKHRIENLQYAKIEYEKLQKKALGLPETTIKRR